MTLVFKFFSYNRCFHIQFIFFFIFLLLNKNLMNLFWDFFFKHFDVYDHKILQKYIFASRFRILQKTTCTHWLDTLILRFALGGFPLAGWAILCNFEVIFLSFFSIGFSISPIFNLATANDRYKNSKEGYFCIYDRSTPWGFITNLVEKIE